MNIKKIMAKLEAAGEWLQLRKNTVVAHWLYGALSAACSAAYFPAGLILMYVFERWERWNDKNMLQRQPGYRLEGDLDWWDGFVVFGFGIAVIIILHFGYSGYSIRWY